MTADSSAWNPGLDSEIPVHYQHLETIFRKENVTTRMSDIMEIASQTGLSWRELVVFRPERLALHELIIRVTADIVVHEGKDETDLGRNFRQIARRLFSEYVQPGMAGISRDHQRLREVVYRRIDRELEETLFTSPRPPPASKGLRRLFPGRTRNHQPMESTESREKRAITSFKERGLTAEDPLSHAIYKGLYRLLNAISGNRGYLGADREFLTRLISDYVCNRYGSRLIGETIAPWLEEAIKREGYLSIRNAEKPLLISLKGASAAGKSSLRPMLRKMMSRRGIGTEGYATISPDIWRRLLLDYDALGEAYKYAGRLTGNELGLVDRKLDHYIRAKSDRLGAMPNLLVDRFRFDSFSTQWISKILHGTYVKHVDTLFMYFVVTPPHDTVERGWERGLVTGRYKAVEDFLDHSVEAYTGMPRVLFKWLAYDKPLFKYEFLDNSVPKGTFPRRIAYGTQREMNILDCLPFVDIERYRKINIMARTPGEVYPAGPAFSIASNMGFLTQCVNKIPVVNFIDPVTGVAYARARKGRFETLDEGILKTQMKDRETAEILTLLSPDFS